MELQSQLKVLIVEDDVLFNKFYLMFLEEREALCTSCLTIAAAEQWLGSPEAQQVDVILLDNHLADGEGVALLPQIKQQAPQAAVIMVSGNEDPDFFLHAFANGIDDYVVKPLNLHLLWVKITRSVMQRRLQAQNQRQQQELAIWISEEQKQQELALHIFNQMNRQLLKPVRWLQSFIQPSGLFSGDVVLHQRGADGSWYVIHADSMGHGLAAAVALLPLMELFGSLASRAMPLSNVIFELNRKLRQQLPEDRFVAAILFKINPYLDALEIWNGGMPPALLFDNQSKLSKVVTSSHMALGILEDEHLDVLPKKLALSEIAKVLTCSDGVFESCTQQHSAISQQDIRHLYADRKAEAFASLTAMLSVSENPADDISICEVDCNFLTTSLLFAPNVPKQSVNRRPGVLSYELELQGQVMAELNPPSQLVDLLSRLAVPQELCDKAYTVLTELYLNAFEHGVLRLDSAIKQQEHGFFSFYQLKEDRSAFLTLQDSIKIKVTWQAQGSQLTMDIIDSGSGFRPNTDAPHDYQHYGRGLTMIANLVDSFTVVGCGNHLKVVMNG